MKKKIVIASTLKPVDDVRGFWKLGQSLAKTNKYEVNIIGNKSKKHFDFKNVFFHPFNLTRRNWLKRGILPVLVLLKIYQLRPQLVIITTHELLWVGVFYRFISNCKLIYDVQENYLANFLYLQSTFKKPIGLLIRLKELLTNPFIDQYLLAEKCYTKELRFTLSKYLILENKAIDITEIKEKIEPNKVLFSGTLSNYSGVKSAVQLFKRIKQYKNYQLVVIGQVHDKKLKLWLENQSYQDANIQLNIDTQPIPYIDILREIKSSTFGIIAYEKNKVNQNKIPTKLFEYSRFNLTSIIDRTWAPTAEDLGSIILIDINETSEIKLPTKQVNLKKETSQNSNWENIELEFVDSIKNLLNNC